MQRAFLKLPAAFLLSSFTVAMVAAQAPAPAPTTDPRVIVVLVYDTSCKKACQLVRPIMKEVSDKYGDKVRYLELNGSKETLKESLRIAKENGVASFLPEAVDSPPDVGIYSAANAKRKLIRELQGAKPKEVYEAAIENAMQQVK